MPSVMDNRRLGVFYSKLLGQPDTLGDQRSEMLKWSQQQLLASSAEDSPPILHFILLPSWTKKGAVGWGRMDEQSSVVGWGRLR